MTDAVLPATDIELASLNIGRRLGRGGQGDVFELKGPHSGLVFKRYLRTDANPGALKRLVDFPQKLLPGARTSLLDRTAWPLAPVVTGRTVCGFVMHAIPDRFRGRTVAGSRDRELSYLLHDPKPLWGNISPPDINGRVELARQTATLLHLLHSHALILGDISMTNLLWASDPAPALFLIDCDGIRRLGGRPVHPCTETSDWSDPQRGTGALDLDNDRYKCALIIGRVLSRNPRVRPGTPLQLLPGIPDRIASRVRSLWEGAARPRGMRPDAHHWTMALN